MGEGSAIQWCQHSWNPWQGCQKVSPGCDNCYMFRDKRRWGQDPETVKRSAPATFRKPLAWNRKAREAGRVDHVFVASWADFFSREADGWRDDAWAIIRECDSLIFQVLTKRHSRIADHLPDDWGEGYRNVWLGVSGENQEWADRRWKSLAEVPARLRFMSLEPLLGPVSMAGWPTRPDWVIVGGESGPDARTFDLAWAASLIAEGRAFGVDVFVKQVGRRPVMYGRTVQVRDSHGGDWDEWPGPVRVRQMPEGT